MAKTAALKTCVSCNKQGDDSVFKKGGRGMCSRCTKKDWESKNPDRLRAQRLRGNAGKRAKEMGWPEPDFSSDWIYQKIKNGYCEVTSIEFDLETQVGKNSHTKNPWVPSIDRIDNSKPYSKDNIQVVVFMYNVCKSEFSHEDVIKFCNSLKDNGRL